LYHWPRLIFSCSTRNENLNPAEFKKQTIEGKEEGLMSLRVLGEHGNEAAFKILEDLSIQQ